MGKIIKIFESLTLDQVKEIIITQKRKLQGRIQVSVKTVCKAVKCISV